jgi:hypothetical protein
MLSWTCIELDCIFKIIKLTSLFKSHKVRVLHREVVTPLHHALIFGAVGSWTHVRWRR